MYHICGILIKYLASNAYETSDIKIKYCWCFQATSTVDDFTLTNWNQFSLRWKATVPKAFQLRKNKSLIRQQLHDMSNTRLRIFNSKRNLIMESKSLYESCQSVHHNAFLVKIDSWWLTTLLYPD